MASRVVLDAGPLVALIDRRDQFHHWALAQAKDLAARVELVTCEAVISEVFFLVHHVPGGVAGLLTFLEEGAVRLDFNMRENLAAVTTLMRKYSDVPMSVADACLVRLTELHPHAPVFTLDSDFKLYRRHGRHAIPLISPAS
jgi:predicted nucleic acid-binding protein